MAAEGDDDLAARIFGSDSDDDDDVTPTAAAEEDEDDLRAQQILASKQVLRGPKHEVRAIPRCP